MKQLIKIFFLLTVLSTCVFAQSKSKVIDKTQLNGVWVFDSKASKADDFTRELYENQDVTISYKEPELKIVETQTRFMPSRKEGETRFATLIFYTDGRGEKNRPFAFSEDLQIESSTIWENNVLVRKYKENIYHNGKLAGNIKNTEKYTLSEDGSTLTIIRQSKEDYTAPFQLTTNKLKRVYKRKQ